MTESRRFTVAAAFDQRAEADVAIDKLRHAGFTQEQIGFVTPEGTVDQAQTPIDKREDKAAGGTVAGAVTGGTIGTLVGAACTALIPGIGLVLTGGLLAGIAMGAATGAAVGGFLGPFIAMGVSEDEARAYESYLTTGRTIVVVAAGDRSAEATTILHNHGGSVVHAVQSREPIAARS